MQPWRLFSGAVIFELSVEAQNKNKDLQKYVAGHLRPLNKLSREKTVQHKGSYKSICPINQPFYNKCICHYPNHFL